MTLAAHCCPWSAITDFINYNCSYNFCKFEEIPMLADVVTMSFILLSSIIGLNVILFSFLLLTSTSVFQLGFCSGLDIQ